MLCSVGEYLHACSNELTSCLRLLDHGPQRAALRALGTEVTCHDFAALIYNNLAIRSAHLWGPDDTASHVLVHLPVILT